MGRHRLIERGPNRYRLTTVAIGWCPTYGPIRLVMDQKELMGSILVVPCRAHGTHECTYENLVERMAD